MAAKITPLDDLPPIVEEQDYAPPQQQQQQPPQQQYAPQQQPPQAQYARPDAPQPPAQKEDPPSLWQTVMQLSMSPVFLKALAVTFLIAFVVLVFPVEDYVLKHVSFAESVPNAGLAVKALAISVATTFWRPPSV